MGPASSPGPSRNENPLGGDPLSVDFKAVFASVVDLLKGVFTPPPASLEREVSRDPAMDPTSKDASRKSSDSSQGLPGDLNSGEEGAVRKDRTMDEEPLRKIQEEVRRAADQLSRHETKVTDKTVRQMVAKVENPDAETTLPVRMDLDGSRDPMKALPQNGAESDAQGKNPLPTMGKMSLQDAQKSQLPVVSSPEGQEVPPAAVKEAAAEAPVNPATLPSGSSSSSIPMAQMVSVEAPVKEALPVRNEAGGRSLSAGDVRKVDGLSSAARAAKSQPAPPDTGRVEFVERLMKAARVTRFRGQSRLRMILSPPRLGSVKVDLVMKDQVMHGKLMTESVAAREAVQSQLQGLKDQLQSQGIQVGELEVGVDSGSSGARPEADANPAKMFQDRSEESGDSVAAEETPAEPNPASSNDDQMIDLVA